MLFNKAKKFSKFQFVYCDIYKLKWHLNVLETNLNVSSFHIKKHLEVSLSWIEVKISQARKEKRLVSPRVLVESDIDHSSLPPLEKYTLLVH